MVEIMKTQGLPQPLQAMSAPQLSEDGKCLEQIVTQTIKVSKEQLLRQKENLQKHLQSIDAQLAMFVSTVEQPKE